MPALSLRVALRRGALLTAANWPIVAVEFVGDSLYKAAVGVPVVGGAVMVAALLGDDLGALLSRGTRAATTAVFASLVDTPIALVSFGVATALVAGGGALVMCLVRAGVMAVFVTGERHAPVELNSGSIRAVAFRRARASNLEVLLAGIRRFGRRFVRLGAWLMMSYVVLFGGYFGSMLATYRLAERTEWISAFPLVVLLASSAIVVAVSAVNFAYLLLQIIIVVEDCRVSEAVGRLRRFLLHDARQVAGVFGVILTVVILGTAASIIATAGLGLIAWVPLVGLAVVPLQAAAWLARGLVFQFIDLAALGAYLAQYRRFRDQE